jgi:alpha-glucoside transport system permease protein
MDSRLITAVIVVVGVPAVLVGYIWATEQVLKLVSERLKPRIRPWLWLLPALLFLFVFLVYPTIGTIVRSFYSKGNILGQHTTFIGLDNYAWFFSNGRALDALKNNVLWLVFLTLLTVGVGLILAILTDKVRYESIAKSVIFLPLAISMVAAAVIWKFMYDYQPPGTPQTGTINAVIGLVGLGPVPWMQTSDWNLTTFALIVIMAWMWTGFAMVILSAALKGINTELLEAARVDGANEWQVFRGIIFPLLLPTIAVVSTTIIITALKAFDIVYATTNGNYDTEVIANLMYKEMFSSANFGRASAIAVVLLLAIIPIMAFNVNRFRAQEAVR